MRTLEAMQQFLALVLMISNQDGHGFAAVTSTFFFFSPRYNAIQNIELGLQGGGISKAMNRVEMVPSKTSAATMTVMRKKVDARERVLRR